MFSASAEAIGIVLATGSERLGPTD